MSHLKCILLIMHKVWWSTGLMHYVPFSPCAATPATPARGASCFCGEQLAWTLIKLDPGLPTITQTCRFFQSSNHQQSEQNMNGVADNPSRHIYLPSSVTLQLYLCKHFGHPSASSPALVQWPGKAREMTEILLAITPAGPGQEMTSNGSMQSNLLF